MVSGWWILAAFLAGGFVCWVVFVPDLQSRLSWCRQCLEARQAADAFDMTVVKEWLEK